MDSQTEKSIAERALAAHEAERESARLHQEAECVRRQASAFDAIARAADTFGLSVRLGDLEVGYPPKQGVVWSALVPVDDDVRLLITSWPDQEKLEIKIRVPDQLYWDLPPGQEKKGPGGGTYGCYRLDSFFINRPILTLADLGAAIARVREARANWRKKHQPLELVEAGK